MARKKKILDSNENSANGGTVKVRLLSSNPAHTDEIVCCDIRLYTYKDVVLEVKDLKKLKNVLKYISIKREPVVAETNAEKSDSDSVFEE